jgi:2-polyprenyl-3-methyl-5-hydroxy-6-metoxy-1,4-benzoquinol methylase
MGLVTNYARRRKCAELLAAIPPGDRILEIGCGEPWVAEHLRATGRHAYMGLDLQPPADVVGSIRDWRALGLPAAGFDTILAFEVLEHVPCYRECFDLLKPGGRLVLTTPVPHWDWACRLLEWAGINQRRTSPHAHLVYVEDIPHFEIEHNRRFLVLGQWAVLRKPLN